MINPKIWSKPSGFISIASGGLPDKPSFLTIDTRIHNDGDSFLCLKGERFDSHSFIHQLVKKDTPVIVFNSSQKSQVSSFFKEGRTSWIEVEDTLKYFQELAFFHIQAWRESCSGKVIALSGSNGKTTTRYMLSHLFREVYSNEYVVTNKKNNNNHIGVPLTIMDINSETRVAIIELGSNSPGEIKVVCDIADPDYSFTTNIGATHLEFFEGIEGVFREESYPHQFSKNNQRLFFVNSEDSFLKRLERGSWTKNLSFQKVENSFIQGSYNFYNLSMAMQIASVIEPDKQKKFYEAAKNFKPTANRGEWRTQGKACIFLDAYNANPSSMKASVEGFLEQTNDQSFLLIIGDMNELGSETETYHRELALWLKEKQIKNIVFIGRFFKFYLVGYPEARGFFSREEYEAEFEKDCHKFERIFLKASRSVALEKLLK